MERRMGYAQRWAIQMNGVKHGNEGIRARNGGNDAGSQRVAVCGWRSCGVACAVAGTRRRADDATGCGMCWGHVWLHRGRGSAESAGWRAMCGGFGGCDVCRGRRDSRRNEAAREGGAGPGGRGPAVQKIDEGKREAAEQKLDRLVRAALGNLRCGWGHLNSGDVRGVAMLGDMAWHLLMSCARGGLSRDMFLLPSEGKPSQGAKPSLR